MDQREELARQLEQEHWEGRAAEELARQQAGTDGDGMWEFEGWTATDRLQVYIAGMGLLRIPVDEVQRLGNALLAEHELHTRGEIL